MKRKGDAAAASSTKPAEETGVSTTPRSAASRAKRAEEDRKRVLHEQARLQLSREGPKNPDTKDFCGAFASIDLDNSWDFAKFKQGLEIDVTRFDDDVVEFDMSGIDPPLANAFRRILIAEVPTVAVGQVTVWQNTGVIHDENLAHRIGLVPFKFEPDELEWRQDGSEFSESNSLRFHLHVICERGRRPVYSSDLKWNPWSDEEAAKYKDNPPAPVCGEILVAQLRSGQEIELDCYLEKGVGKEHAKWSPVCTAFYRLLPEIRLTKDITGENAERLKKVCPVGVFDIEDMPSGGKRAIVADARKCTTCRECLESFPGEKEGLLLEKNKQHFLFSIESTGSIPAPLLFEKALGVFEDKCDIATRVLESRDADVDMPA